mmetsp:Transcript_91363/g.143443  ORF Transcript_91363/g.143443 Transcript_91363/m.143443 type:complete len:91 (+) Transcript_91363:70-342(+)
MAGDSASSGSKPSAATSIAGQRQVAKRGAGTRAAPKSGGKSSGGSMLNYQSDKPGLQVGPTTVLVMALAFMAVVCALHIIGKFRSAASGA